MDDPTRDTADGPRDDRGTTDSTDDTASGRSTKDRFSDGIRQGIGVLSAFRDALEETINEARERGDLSTERAREVVRTAMDRAKDATEEARERLDFATHHELDDLRATVEELRARVTTLETMHRAEPVDDALDDAPGGTAQGT